MNDYEYNKMMGQHFDAHRFRVKLVNEIEDIYGADVGTDTFYFISILQRILRGTNHQNYKRNGKA